MENYEKILELIVLILAILLVIKLLCDKYSKSKKAPLKMKVNKKILDEISDENDDEDIEDLEDLEELEGFTVNDQADIELPYSLDKNKEVADDVPDYQPEMVLDASQQPAVFQPGESLVLGNSSTVKNYNDVGINPNKLREHIELGKINLDGEKSLMDDYAMFRDHTNQDSNNLQEDPVDLINRLYREGNTSNARRYQGKKIKDVFHELTGGFKNDDRCFIYK